jgi:hypothetical protein
MLRIQNISQVMQTRTLRVNYGNTEAYPSAHTLDPNVYDVFGTKGSLFAPGGGSVPGLAGQGPIWPGQIMSLTKTGQQVAVAIGPAVGGTSTVAGFKPFGLMGNFVGGNFDEVGDYREVGVWKGPGSQYEVLYPVYNTNITTSLVTSGGTARYLWWDNNGLLAATQPATAITGPWAPVANLLDVQTNAKIYIELLV